MSRTNRLPEIAERHARSTPGPWHLGHFADQSHPCGCTTIVSEVYAGSICDITVGNELSIEAGGNDSPPPEEAIANGRFISEARTDIPYLLTLIAELQAKAKERAGRKRKGYDHLDERALFTTSGKE